MSRPDLFIGSVPDGLQPMVVARLAHEAGRDTPAALIYVARDGRRVLDMAEAAAEAAKVKLEPVLLQARDVGAALVDEATERQSDLLILGLPYRKRFGGDFAIGRTIPYVLKNAPCPVWVVREPMTEEQL